jgi:hypothetical protein
MGTCSYKITLQDLKGKIYLEENNILQNSAMVRVINITHQTLPRQILCDEHYENCVKVDVTNI